MDTSVPEAVQARPVRAQARQIAAVFGCSRAPHGRQTFCLTLGAGEMGDRFLHEVPEVFSLAELARATGTPLAQVQAWAETGAIRTLPAGDGRTWISRREAVASGRALLAGTLAADVPPLGPHQPPALFDARSAAVRPLGTPLAVSSSLHVAAVAVLVIATSLGVGRAAAPAADVRVEPEKLRLVYLALPGPGGGGGGGGIRQKLRPPRARRAGTRSLDTPLPVRRPPELPEPVEIPRDPEPPPVEPEPLPPVIAPVVSSASDETDRAGVVEDSPSADDSRGPGEGGGVGTGDGTGLGEGEGAGIGDGSGGGTGGGPYRPGSGISPPSLVREVKPRYTEEARRRGVEGDVVLEIVVKRDGTVGDVDVLRGLGYGLDEQAVTAVRRWRFQPARLKGTPVDVLVEVAMEFKLR